MRRLLALLLFGFALVVAVPLIAQDQMSEEEQRDWLVQFVEGRLSTPERQIRISNIDGVLSDNATIRAVTISDSEGVWLRITNATINWDQGQLFLGRLFVRSLSAESIEFLRNPVPSTDVSLPAPEAQGFEIPEFPVAIILESLSVPKVAFGESVFGLGSEIAVAGSLTLEGGSLDANLDITRLDGPGGQLVASVDYRRPDNSIDVAVMLTEPENGILVNLLNIENRPSLSLAVTGSGPVADLRTELTLDAGGRRALSGLATITQQAEGLAVVADLHGPVGDLVAPAYKAFFGADTALRANALVRSAAGVSIPSLTLSGGQLSLTAAAETAADGFLRELTLRAEVADPAGTRVLLPVPGTETTVGSATLDIDYGGATGEQWSAVLAMADFATGDLMAKTLALQASGIAANLEDAANRRLTFNGDGTLSGIVTRDPATQAALGDTIGLGIAGMWSAGQPLQIAELRVGGEALSLVLAGALSDFVFDGTVGIDTQSLAPFSDLAGRDLAGALALEARGTISPLSGGFNLTLDGTSQNLQISEAALDRVLAGSAQLSGRIARTENGLEAEAFRIANPQVAIAADGTFATGSADLRFTLDLADLALVSEDASGALSVVGTAKGEGTIALDLDATVDEGILAGRRLTYASAGFSGTLSPENILTGTLAGSGYLDGFRLALSGGVSASEAETRLAALRLEAGPTLLTGDLVRGGDGLLNGNLVVASPNITTAAALLLTEASGAVNATIALVGADGRQDATVNGTVAGLRAPGVAVGSADVRASVADLFGVPRIDGTVAGRDIVAAGIAVARLDATASRQGETTGFSGTMALVNGTAVEVAGGLAPLDGGYRLAVDRASLTQGQVRAVLAAPVALTIAGDSVALDAIRFDVGSGRITATGTAGTTLDIRLAIEALPLSIANAIQPSLGLAGTINGSARIFGAATSPQAEFNLRGAGISAAALAGYGVTPLGFSATGSFAGNAVRLASLSAEGSGGLRLTASGTVPLTGRGLAIAITGSVPLALGNRLVADRGGQLSGTAAFNLEVSGSVAAPRLSGSVSTAGAGYVDPELNLRLVDIAGRASVSAEALTIETLSGRLSTGGSVSVGGSIGLGRGNPANLSVRLNSARYADGNLFVATVSGDLALTGPLVASPLLSGRLSVEKADISVPELGGSSTPLIDVAHVDPPPAVVATLARATVDAGGAPIPQSRPSVLQLDVVVDAPNQIFIRGRGLDVELGGSVRLTGPVTDVRPVGAFELNRGRLSILGQRITFTDGVVTLVGDLDPYLNLVARTEGEGVTIFVTVSGRVSEIEVAFTSSPALPEDEVLSRLLFNRATGELSPLQLARLAGAAAELAGGGGNSLVNSLRMRAGFDDLEVVTDESGNLAVQAGTYVQDNLYLGVQAGAGGDSRVTVDLDITDEVKARASAGVNGESSIGIFYESDY